MISLQNKYDTKTALVTIFAFVFVLFSNSLHTHDALLFSSKGDEVFAHDCSNHQDHTSVRSHFNCIQCQRVKIKEFDLSSIQSTIGFLQKFFFPLNSDEKPFRSVTHTHPDTRGPPSNFS
ncbi:MAG: hypothetical protein QME58_01410 [Bacteroidota bacterium]|nr:hypothetical protein [Bacteroidota bacterium]